MFNSFNPSYYDLKMTDVKIDFVEGAYFEIIDPDSGEVSYLKISTLIGQETKEVPKVGDYVLSEEKIRPELEAKEEKKKSLWDEEFKMEEQSSSSWSIDWEDNWLL